MFFKLLCCFRSGISVNLTLKVPPEIEITRVEVRPVWWPQKFSIPRNEFILKSSTQPFHTFLATMGLRPILHLSKFAPS